MRFYLKSTIRNARKNGVLSFAKLIGITLSFSVVLFAAGFVFYETNFDKSIPDFDRIFRSLMVGKLDNNDADFAVTSPRMAGVLVEDLPEITEALRIFAKGEIPLFYEDKVIEGGNLLYADSNFFSFFSLPLVTTVSDPFASENNIAVSESLATKHFGSIESALNKVIRLQDEDYVIASVFKDFPRNFHLQFDVILSIDKTNPDQIGWYSQAYITYFKTSSSKIDIENLSFKITKTVYTHSSEEVDGANATTWEDLKYGEGTYLFYPAEPLRDIHFSNHRFDPAVTSNKTYVYGAIILAILVLLISSINYINLSIADLSTRFKEIGIHKTSGAFNNQIAARFVFESLLFWITGFIIALLVYDYFGESLGIYLGFDIRLSRSLFLKVVFYSFLLLILFNLVSNILPISYLSSRKVLSLIKNQKSDRYFSIKSSFIFFQFVLSALIILSSIIVQKQINFIVTKDRGYETENIITLRLWDMKPDTRKLFTEELRTHAAIISVATSEVFIGDDPGMTSAYFETQEDQNYFHTSVLPVDYDFLNTFGLVLLEGRFFQKDRKSDGNTVILNETALREYDKPTSLIGKKVLLGGSDPHTVIGIVEDFNFRSLHHQLLPLVITLSENNGNLFIKTNTNQIPEVLKILDKQWTEFNMNRSMHYGFHDEVLAAHYAKDQQAKRLLLILTIISISIACIGLYAISFFIIIRKTKEIGIRKVNGAGVTNVVLMLNISFVKWVCIACLIASPVAWIIMKKWLENFAYKTALSWWIFALAAGLSLGIALFTLSWQSWRAASRNPVEALRYE